MEKTVAVLLAGGRSRRMGGREKSLLAFADTTLIHHIYKRLAPQVDKVVISANGNPERFAMADIPVVPDLRQDRAGPLAGLEAVMTVYNAPWFLTVPSDTPMIPLDLLKGLGSKITIDKKKVVIAKSGQRHHHVIGLWPREVLPLISKALDDDQRAIKHWLAANPHQVVEFAFSQDGSDPFFNINTPEELLLAKAKFSL
ncbi:MAG: molybdenum cofactor guanylyltransferase [Magnetococcales bacterium]|nr:molybdenum cofactor guanylyltransferase [Magnetococcales bacterium]